MIFAISDGVEPSATERGYVVRRLIRRALRYGTKLQANTNFLNGIVFEVCEMLIKEYGYDELKDKSCEIQNVVKEEEKKFSKVMKKGLKLFNQMLEKANQNRIPIEDLCNLYTTYGFPFDIIKQLCDESNIQFDISDTEKYMEECKKKSKEGKKFK